LRETSGAKAHNKERRKRDAECEESRRRHA
jgi:hypothetical protein